MNTSDTLANGWNIRAVGIVSTFSSLVVTLTITAPDTLRVPNAISAAMFTTLFGIPVMLALISKGIAEKWNSIRRAEVLAVLSGLCEGEALGLGLNGLLVTYYWYSEPSISHFEPLTVLLGAAAGVSQYASNRIQRYST